MERYICIHGHFFQEPRENPWLEEIEIQDSAYPYHDRNEKVCAECYEPNARARLMNSEGRIVQLVNNYTKMSFDFGPTLLTWLERLRPEVYESILEADRISVDLYSGHGSAVAQTYNHMIMPLAGSRDKSTQVYWAVRDFRKRFKRDPEGMWLPECAVDTETLDLLAQHGVKFTILAPRQAAGTRRLEGGGSEWDSVDGDKLDCSMPYLYRLPSGKTISLFFYNGPISNAVASGDLLRDGTVFADALASAFGDGAEGADGTEGADGARLVHVASEGEHYGHHHINGDMALAYCLNQVESGGTAKITNYGEFLEKHPPTHEVRIRENSSWSCSHGVERWRSDCGCNTGRFPGWKQHWRKPLREVMDALRDQMAPAYQHTVSRYLRDPWAARDDYIELVLDRSPENVESFFGRHAQGELSAEKKVQILKLLEVQRYAMYMYASCGWFHEDVSEPESLKVIEYAARAMQLFEEALGFSLESQFIANLEQVPASGDSNARTLYERWIIPEKVDLPRVGAHYAISSLLHDYPQQMSIFNYSVDSWNYEKMKSGRLTLATGQARIRDTTTWDESVRTFAALHFGDHNIMGGLGDFDDTQRFEALRAEVREAFERGNSTEIVQILGRRFGKHNYSLKDLFLDEQRKVLGKILEVNTAGIEVPYREIYEQNTALMNFMSVLHIPIPGLILAAAEQIINIDLKGAFTSEDIDLEKLERLITEARKWGVGIDGPGIAAAATLWLAQEIEAIGSSGGDGDGHGGGTPGCGGGASAGDGYDSASPDYGSASAGEGYDSASPDYGSASAGDDSGAATGDGGATTGDRNAWACGGDASPGGGNASSESPGGGNASPGRICKVLKLLGPLQLDLDLWKIQNMHFLIRENGRYERMREEARAGDEEAGNWLDDFCRLGRLLNIEVEHAERCGM